MVEKDFNKLELNLIKAGYRKITQGCYSQTEHSEDYDYYKAFRNNKDQLLYQIFYRVWDYTTERNKSIRYKVGEHLYGVEFAILPESRTNRCDLQNIFVDDTTDYYIYKMEEVAKNFYKFAKKNNLI